MVQPLKADTKQNDGKKRKRQKNAPKENPSAIRARATQQAF
jgi:hypothetical protein